MEFHNRVVGTERLIFGTSNLAGMYEPVARADALATLNHAVLELGVRDLDTAPHYGAGYAESLLGEAWSGWPPDVADAVRVTTKCGRLVRRRGDLLAGDPRVAWTGGDFFQLDGSGRRGGTGPPARTGGGGGSEADPPDELLLVHDYSAAGVRRSVDESLRRLGRTRLHGLRLHDAETEERFAEAVAPGTGAVAGMVRLRDEAGLVDRLSLGMNSASFALRFLHQFPGVFDEVLLAGCWNLIDQSGLQVLEECRRQGVTVVLAGVFGAGLLWGRPHYRYEPASTHVQAQADQWGELCAKHGVTLPAAALAFAATPVVVSKLCIGCQSVAELDANVRAAATVVPQALWNDAYAMGLLKIKIAT